jgi:hypothetical protein
VLAVLYVVSSLVLLAFNKLLCHASTVDIAQARSARGQSAVAGVGSGQLVESVHGLHTDRAPQVISAQV